MEGVAHHMIIILLTGFAVILLCLGALLAIPVAIQHGRTRLADEIAHAELAPSRHATPPELLRARRRLAPHHWPVRRSPLTRVRQASTTAAHTLWAAVGDSTAVLDPMTSPTWFAPTAVVSNDPDRTTVAAR